MFELSSCIVPRPLKLTDKTQEVKKTYSLITKDTLTVIKPFVLSGGISDMNIVDKMKKSLFDDSLRITDYKRDVATEKTFTKYSMIVYKKYFKKNINLSTPEISREDSMLLKKEIETLERKMHDSVFTSVRITNSMERILSKYNGSLFLLTNITEYYIEGFYTGNPYKLYYNAGRYHRIKNADWILFKVFVVDVKQKQIVFYQYKFNIWNSHLEKNSSPPDILKSILKSFYKR